jgi:TRAP-type C4-dicarboxylate transport system permease small subunit
MKWLSLITSGVNFIGAVWVFLLAALICADIFMRWLLNSPILGVPEFVQYSIAGIIYLQLGQAIKSGKMIRSDAFYSQLHRKFPLTIQGLLALCDMACAGIFGLLAVGMCPELLESIQMNYQIGNRLYFTLPDWPIKFIILLGSAIAFIHSAIQAATHVAMAMKWLPLPSDPSSEMDY